MQAEFWANGRFAYRYDLSHCGGREATALPDGTIANVAIGASLGRLDWTTNAIPTNVTSFAFHPLSPDDATNHDRDGDGLSLLDELFAFGTDPDHPDTDRDGTPDGAQLEVLTAEEIMTYRLNDPRHVGDADLIRRERHYFGQVPLIEYWNNCDETGDFAAVLPLIDGYDLLQTERVRDKEEFADSLLVLTGCQLEQGWHTRTVTGPNGDPVEERVPDEDPARRLRRERCLSLPDSEASAQYLTHSLHEADTEVLRAALKEDIHKFSFVPDLSDKQFAQNLSGVAMRYKLMGLERMASVKERWFREGLRTRLAIYARMLGLSGLPVLDTSGVKAVFTRADS